MVRPTTPVQGWNNCHQVMPLLDISTAKRIYQLSVTQYYTIEYLQVYLLSDPLILKTTSLSVKKLSIIRKEKL